MTEEELRDKIADLQHKQWIQWAKTLMSNENLSSERRERWFKLFIPYEDLSEESKNQDREWADRFLALFREAGWKSGEEIGEIEANKEDIERARTSIPDLLIGRPFTIKCY